MSTAGPKNPINYTDEEIQKFKPLMVKIINKDVTAVDVMSYFDGNSTILSKFLDLWESICQDLKLKGMEIHTGKLQLNKPLKKDAANTITSTREQILSAVLVYMDSLQMNKINLFKAIEEQKKRSFLGQMVDTLEIDKPTTPSVKATAKSSPPPSPRAPILPEKPAVNLSFSKPAGTTRRATDAAPRVNASASDLAKEAMRHRLLQKPPASEEDKKKDRNSGSHRERTRRLSTTSRPKRPG